MLESRQGSCSTEALTLNVFAVSVRPKTSGDTLLGAGMKVSFEGNAACEGLSVFCSVCKAGVEFGKSKFFFVQFAFPEH